MSLSGTLKAAFWGAVSGAVTFGIGECFQAGTGVLKAATEFSKTFGGVMVRAAAHGIAQGTLAMMQNNGAGFLSGAAGGFFGSLGATAWGGAGGKWQGIGGNFAGSDVGTIAFGALSGGVGAELSGGNFWQGAIAGGIVSGLNHVMHNAFDEDGIDPPKKGRKSPTLDEANKHYREGNGAPMTVDASTIDLNFLDTSKMVKGNTYGIQTLTTSKDGRVYGGITVKYEGNNQVSILPDTYNFEQHGSFFSSTFRNTANAIGRWYAGSGTPYKINFTGVNTIHYSSPPINTYHQTSHGFRF